MENNFSLKEEIKCDFLITEKRKKIWKIELELLSKLIEVCEKYHLKYLIVLEHIPYNFCLLPSFSLPYKPNYNTQTNVCQ